jgi:cytochrome c peroxidase
MQLPAIGRNWSRVLGALVVLLVMVMLIYAMMRGVRQSAGEPPGRQEPGVEEKVAAAADAIVPLPRTIAADPARAALGARLFADSQLSRDGTRSCASCHPLERGGMDGQRRASAGDGKSLLRNTPSIFNLAFDLFYNWDGSTESLPAHGARVLHSPALMAMDDGLLLSRLQRNPTYRQGFAQAYRDGLTAANVVDALSVYERTLVTPDSRFDRYLRGERSALNAEEQRGFQLFSSLGCIACHQGQNIGGNLLQRFGVFEDTAAQRLAGEPIDYGRYARTGDDADREVFRVPSLRNVAVTAPYFHDGRAPTLPLAVATMARVQLGRPVADQDIQAIVAFLKTLTGRYQGRELQAPQ